jgi:hypothetical protein
MSITCARYAGVTLDAIDKPGGFQHYKDLKLLINEALDTQPQCRLCGFILDALDRRQNTEGDESIVQQIEEVVEPLAVQLSSLKVWIPTL